MSLSKANLLSVDISFTLESKVSNAAISRFLHLMKYFTKLVGHAFNCDVVVKAFAFVPITSSTVHRQLALHGGNCFIDYIVCPTCDGIYEFKDCNIQTGSNTRLSKTCCHAAFPDHPHTSRRAPCGTVLLKRQKTKSGCKLVPIKAYPYFPLKKSITQMINWPTFFRTLEREKHENTKWIFRRHLDQPNPLLLNLSINSIADQSSIIYQERNERSMI